MLKMHPDDAAARGVTDGDAVRVFNELGDVHCLVEVTDADPRGHGQPRRRGCGGAAPSTSTATALAPATLTDLAGGACFNDARVEVARILEASWEGKPLAVFVPAGDDVPVQ